MLALLYSSLLVLALALSAHASLYVISPLATTSCRAAHPCTVEWLDDGAAPLLAAIGVATVGLYTGDEELVQTLPPVDVSTAHSLVFTPDPRAGPNSNSYYIMFTSTSLNSTDPSGRVNGHYQAFSANFRLTQMTGSRATHPASDTATRPLPVSLRSPAPHTAAATETETETVGTLSASASGMVTATTPGASASSGAGAGVGSGAQTNGAAARGSFGALGLLPLGILVLL